MAVVCLQPLQKIDFGGDVSERGLATFSSHLATCGLDPFSYSNGGFVTGFRNRQYQLNEDI